MDPLLCRGALRRFVRGTGTGEGPNEEERNQGVRHDGMSG